MPLQVCVCALECPFVCTYLRMGFERWGILEFQLLSKEPKDLFFIASGCVLFLLGLSLFILSCERRRFSNRIDGER